jgi:predicted nuclease with TOPRIM domain
MIPAMDDYEVVAQELSTLGEKLRELEKRVAEVERVNARLEEAALSTARGLSEVSHRWDMVYEAMRRPEKPDADKASERDNAAARKRRDQ